MPTDAELDVFILTRLKILGIDISVLPVDDANAPADQRRILASARGVLKNTVPTVSNYLIDVQDFPPVLYPAALAAIIDR
jgi:hypothetical protein